MKRITENIFQIVLIICCISLPSAANSEWLTTLEDDLFSDSKKVTMIGVTSLQNGIHFFCDKNGYSLSFIEKGEYSDAWGLVTADMIVKVDNGKRHGFVATGYEHNSEFYGLRVKNDPGIRDVLNDLVLARRKLQLGVKSELFGIEWSGTWDVRGSTTAAKRAIDNCEFAQKVN